MAVTVPADGMAMDGPAGGVAVGGSVGGVGVGGVSETQERRLRRGAFCMAGTLHSTPHTRSRTMRTMGRERDGNFVGKQENESRFIGGPSGRGSKTYPQKETKTNKN